MDAATGYAYPQAIKFIKGMKSVRDGNKRRVMIALAWTAAGLIVEVAFIAFLASSGAPLDLIVVALSMLLPLELLFLVVFNVLVLSNVSSDPSKLTYAMECKAYLQSEGYTEARLEIASDMADDDRKIIQTRHIVTGVAFALLLAFAGAVLREPTTPIVIVVIVAFAFVFVIGRYASDAEQELADVVLRQAASLCREDIIREKEEQAAQERADQSQSQSTRRSGWM
jgi:hypothetical protein